MAVQRLNLTRDQLASFLQDFEQIKQFEKLFSTVDTINTVTLDEISISADSAFATANEALAQISGISTALDSLLLAPRNELGTISSQNADNVNITGGLISGLDAPLPVASGGTGQTSYTDGQLLIGNTTGNTLARATLTAGTGIAITNGSGSVTIAATGGTGTVTSVGLSGGTTGLTATSDTTNPITTSGTFTLGGTLVVANGGTGATNATDARTNLVAAKSGANSDITSMSGITGGISLVDNIDFDTTAVVAGAVGRLVWNDGDGTLDLGLKGGNVTLQVGQEEVQRSFNEAGAAIVEGNVIYVSGAQGNRIAVSIAKANAAATSLGTIGMATENIANGAEGFITTQGLVRKLNTILDSEGNALAEGDLLYLSATVLGGYTKIRPDTPNFHVFVGYVVRVHATVGSIFIRPNVYPSLDEINGIKIVSTASGNTLIYDAVAGYYKTNTLTAGTNVSISNGPGTITINATDQFVGTVTSVSGTGTVNGITLTGTVTSSGSLTLGGTLSGVSLTTQVSGTLPVANGGTGVATSTGTGSVVLSNTPTLVTPTLGVASATSIATGLGAVGTPAHTFTGDLNTGMWSPAADTVAVSTAGAERVRVTSAGNVGFGAVSPIAYAGYTALTIEGATNGGVINLRNSAVTAHVEIAATTSEGYIKTVAALPLTFGSSNLERVRITAAGNVGIGTTAPTAKLTVAGGTSGFPSLGTASGGFFLSSSNGLYGLYAGIHDPSGVAWLQEMRNDAATAYAISLNPSGGNIGIGTTAPAYQLQLSTDSAAKPTSALWTIASDSRVKTETGEYTKGLDAVCALRPITYQYNGAAGFTADGKENISIVAQEAMQHFPECVGTFEALLNKGDEEKTELYNWNGHALTFALVNAIKELKASNDALTARVAQLEEK